MADAATVISMAPYSFEALFPHCSPSNITIPAADKDDFTYVHISRIYAKVYIDSERGYIQRPITSDEVANSIVNDHLSSIINCIPGIAQPGIFFIDGHLNKQSIKKEHEVLLIKYRGLQKTWFTELVKQADSDWAKTHSPRSISTIQKNAAESLNLKREWNTESVIDNIILCPVCKNDTRGAIVCPNCKFIMNEKEYASIKDKFAKV